MAVERVPPGADFVHAEKPINLPKQVIVWRMGLEIEVVEQLRRSRLPAHHRQIFPTTQTR